MALPLPKARFELEFNNGSEYTEVDRAAVLRVMESNAPSCGGEVLDFEKEFAEFNHSRARNSRESGSRYCF